MSPEQRLAEFVQTQRLMAAFDQRVADHGLVTCPRCKREARGWPLKRADLCSPKHWVYCIRDPWDIK